MSSRLVPSLLAAGALLLSPAAARAATYYVSPTGSDTNAGTQASPFRQIRRALQPTAAGDTVLVADGSYLGFDVRNKNGTPQAPITIKALGTAAVVTATTDRPDNRDTIFITFSSNVIVDGLRSFNANRAAVRVDQSPRITVRNGVFGNNGTWGIFTDFSDDLVLEYNECYGSVNEHGIYVSNSGDRPVVRGNICRDNRASGIQLNADIHAGGDGIISGALLENNVCYNNGAGGGAALNLDGVQDSTVRNNLLFNNKATGIVNYQGDGAAGPRGMVIVHNTIDQPADGRWCLLIANTTGLNVVRNNILFTRHSFRGSLLYGDPADVANTSSDYNVLSKATPDGDATIYTLAQWQALGHEPHSLTATSAALWVNPTAADYHLKTGSPAVDLGDNANSAPKDLDGRTRPQGAKVDLGCFELAAAAPPDTTPPAVPSGLTLAPGDGRIDLAWNANTEPDLAGYFIYRATASAGPFTRQNQAPLTLTALTQTGLNNGQPYWYSLTAVDHSGNESGPGETRSGTPQAPPDTTPPAAPTGLTLTPGDAAIGLAWTANSEPDLAGYHVYRAPLSGGPFVRQNAAPLTGTALTQTGLINGQAYWYRLTAVDHSGNESSPGAAQGATPTAPPDTTPPAPPTGLQATPGNALVVLAWPANSEADLAGYAVYRAQNAAGPFTRQNAALLTTPTLSQSGLSNGVTYWFYVTAFDQSGNESAKSATVSATPTAPTPPPATLASLSFSPSTLRGGQSTVGTVTLSGPAPAGGATVSLKSAHGKVKVPPSVRVPAGALSVSFNVKTARVGARKRVTVTATYSGVKKSAALTLLR